MQTGNTGFIYKNKLDKACSQHDMGFVQSKGLSKRTQSDKVLRDKVFKAASDPKYDRYQRGLASSFLIKNLVEVVLPLRLQINLLLNQIINLQMNFTGRLLENLRNEKFIFHLETIFGVLIQLICNH